MKTPNRFYTYAYLREDGTPYYIGKGCGTRIIQNTNRNCYKPKDKSRIIFLKQNLTEEEAFKHEIYMIAVFGRKDLGTGILRNLTDGGEGGSGAIRSSKIKEKISNSMKGRIFTDDHKKNLSKALTGKKVSEETKQLWSSQRKGKTPSEETKIKMSEKKKGSKHNMFGVPKSEETKRKISEAKKGKKLSKETRAKMSEAKKGKLHSEETKMKIRQSKKKINNKKDS